MFGIFCVMCGRTIFSRVFAMGERSEIGLYEEPELGSLFGLGIGIILASFQMCGIMLLFKAFISSNLKYSMASGPKCLRCFMFMLSGPVELLFLAEFIACLTCSVVISVCADSSLCVFLSMILLCLLVEYFVELINCLLKAVAICLFVICILLSKVIVLFGACLGFLLDKEWIVFQRILELCLWSQFFSNFSF